MIINSIAATLRLIYGIPFTLFFLISLDSIESQTLFLSNSLKLFESLSFSLKISNSFSFCILSI